MTGRRLGALVVAVLLTLAACDSGTGGTGAGVALTLTRTGGFAGVHDEIVIDADGGWRATDRAGNQRTGRLTDQQRDNLRALAADPRLTGEAARSPAPTRCADVYNYALTVNTLRIGFVDCHTDADPPPAARAIVTAVTEVVGT